MGLKAAQLDDAARRQPRPQPDREPRRPRHSGAAQWLHLFNRASPSKAARSSSISCLARRSTALSSASICALKARRLSRSSGRAQTLNSAPVPIASSGRASLSASAIASRCSLTRIAPAWIWRVELENHGRARAMDAVLIQDIGLGGRGFLMNNEAYVSQYIDHFIAPHARFGNGRHEPPESGAGRAPSLRDAWLPRRRGWFCDRRQTAFRASLSRR